MQARHTDRGTAIADALARFPAKPGPADWNLCLSHRRRRLINAECQALAARRYRESFPDGLVVHLEPPNTERVDANAAQPSDIVQVTTLIGRNTDAQIVNGVLLIVTKITAKKVWLKDEETQKTCQLTHAGVMRHTRLRHNITIQASQGKTLEGVVRVWDVHSRYFDTTHLYVDCSRCRGAEYLQVMGGDSFATKKRIR